MQIGQAVFGCEMVFFHLKLTITVSRNHGLIKFHSFQWNKHS